MKCILCGQETIGSIGGKNICPDCDCGIPPQQTTPTIQYKPPISELTKEELIIELSKRGVRVLTIDPDEEYVIASKERHCVFGKGAAHILVVKE